RLSSMKVKHLSFLVLLVAMLGCNQDDENLQALNGTYRGIFVRDQQAVKVELSFDNGTYQGYSERYKFPAICRGTYTVSGNKIIFANDCPWTAEFDWTLILSGEWDFNLIGSTLILTHSNEDKYALTRQ